MDLLRRATPPLALLFLVVALALHARPLPQKAPVPPPVALAKKERLLVLAPHPDDDILAGGALLLKAAGPKRVVYVTAGEGFAASVKREFSTEHPSPAQHRAYAAVRHKEATSALSHLVPRAGATSLGFPDKSLTRLLLEPSVHRSAYTRAERVPYGFADAQSAHSGSVLFGRLQGLIRSFRPTVVLIPLPLDAHLDHRALAALSQLALADLVHRQKLGRVRLLSFPTHVQGWPETKGFHPQLPLTPPAVLSGYSGLLWRRVDLAPKQAMRLGCAATRHRTQLRFLEPLMLSFARKNGIYAAVQPLPLKKASMYIKGPPAAALPLGPRGISFSASPAGAEVRLSLPPGGSRNSYRVAAIEASGGRLVRWLSPCLPVHRSCTARLLGFHPGPPFLLAISSPASLTASLYIRLITPVGAGPAGPGQS